MKYYKPFILIFLVLLADQVLKIWIKTNMYLGQEFHIAGNWFIIHFTENNGIAFGLEFGGVTGKIFLTFFRMAAAGLIIYFILRSIKLNYPGGFVLCLALIFSGAFGNIIDSIFYGIVFDYAPVFQGRVVDMFYFPIIKGYYPDWFPFFGGNYFVFFRPVFNISDASITTGVFSLFIFYSKWLKKF